MNIHIRLFGSLAELVGKQEFNINDCMDTNAVKEKLITEFPQLKKCEFLISVNKQIVKTNQKLEPGNEIAFLPPYAGG